MRWTELAEPLPSPPASKFDNVEALDTIHSHPDLFAITTPINIDRFESLLSSHPNQPFVHSVCRGLRKGFWPFANTHYGEWPLTWDNSQRTPKTPDEAMFLQEQIDKCSLDAIQSPLGLICCQECTACPSMLFPSLGAASFVWLLITVLVSSLSIT